MELAEQGGFEAVRLRDVAAHAGVALGTVYKRFKSKEDILVAALGLQMDAFEMLMSHTSVSGATPAERVSRFFEAVTRAFLVKPNFARAVIRAVASGDQVLTDKVARFHTRVSRLIEGVMAGDAPASELAFDANRMAYLLQQVWFASMIGWMGGLHDSDEAVQQTAFAANHLLT